MDSKKRKKSGHEFRKDKRNKDLQETAKVCTKITSFYRKPSPNTYLKNKDNCSSSSIQEPVMDTSISLFDNQQKENPIGEVRETSSIDCMSYTETISTLNSTSTSEPLSQPILSPVNISIYQENSTQGKENTICELQGISNNDTLSINEKVTTENFTSTLESFSNPIPSPIKKSTCRDISALGTKDYFSKPRSQMDLLDFFSFHPCQPDEQDLPFAEKKAIFSIKQNDGQIFYRQWLSYNKSNKKLYCFICLAYNSGNSTFCSGFDDWRHVHQRIEQHELSKAHRESVICFIARKQNRSTHQLLFNNQSHKKRQEVLERRHIIQVIVDVLKLIGKQGLAFRASIEQAYTFNNHSINHGNFLEIILLLGKYDTTLKKHLDAITSKSQKLHQANEASGKKAAGRGNFVTFLSNNTVMKIIKIIENEIKKRISEKVNIAIQYSILMDTTIDVSGNDQCAFVIRFVEGHEVNERLLALKCVSSTTADGLLNSLSSTLSEANISIKNCVANAFDGASNMSGPYNGLTAKLSQIVPNHIHTWCYAHVLNLVISDTAQVLPISTSFFNLMQDTQVFLKESLKRQQKFREENPAYKLEAIGATRWRSRSNACIKIFGRIDDWTSQPENSQPTNYVFFELIVALHKIAVSRDFNSKIRNEADSLLVKFTSFETILVAMTFLQIFKITTPLSDYLQTKNLDYAQAWRLIESALQRLNTVRSKFNDTLLATQNFVSIINEKKENYSQNENIKDLTVEANFRKKRQRKIKKMPSEKCEDERPNSSPEDEFRVNTFNYIIDTIVQTMNNRFMQHKNLYLDLSLFDPKRFKQIKIEEFPTNALDKICCLIPSLEKQKLKEELISFISVWPSIKRKSLNEDYKTTLYNQIEIEKNEPDLDLNEFEEDTALPPCNQYNECNSCIKCALELIIEYNMYSLQYTKLYKVYKYLLTIPLTQVSCERVFSKLKLIKTRLRSSMTNETLEAFVMMHTEKDVLNSIEPDFVTNKLIESSTEMRRLLTL